MRIVVWPFVALWKIFETIVALTGRFIAVAIGLTLIIVGAVLTVTIVGAIIGIPLIAMGLMLVARGLF